jgi:hypothetical protein
MTDEIYHIKVKDGSTQVEVSGDKRFVNKVFNNLKDVLSKELKKPGMGRKKGKKRGRKPKKPKKLLKKDRPDLKELDLEGLLEKKPPKRENQRILLMGYYMNKIEGKREFRGKDLEKLYKDLKLKVPKNVTYFLRKLSEDEKGLLTHGKKQGRYKITEKGIDFIHDKIPTAK